MPSVTAKSMGQSPSSGADSHLASRGISRL
jgi:hypothetical protein